MDWKTKKILLTGGGTGGSVAPLLAVADELKREGGFEFLWLGTKFGPERGMTEKAGIEFKAIASGKLRRYWDWRNFIDIFKIKIGFWQAFFIMLKWRPDMVMTCGSFVSVPAAWAGWILRVPVMVHQQDVLPGLANKLMAPFARVVTVTFEESLKDYGKKAVWTGNPIRKQLSIKNYAFVPSSGRGELRIKMRENLPVVLILGGGTGSRAINELVENSLSDLTEFCQVIHVTGKNKSIKNYAFVPSSGRGELRITNYKNYEFLNADQMASAMQAADLVVTRAGLSTLTELSFLKKPAVIIPMPRSHQEANADFFKVRKAAIVIGQESLNSAGFAHLVKDLLADEKMRNNLSKNIGQAMKAGASQAVIKIIKQLI